MSQEKWIKITNSFPNSRCIQCSDSIGVGESCLWLKGFGVKHEECPTGIIKDDSVLVVIEPEDNEVFGIR